MEQSEFGVFTPDQTLFKDIIEAADALSDDQADDQQVLYAILLHPPTVKAFFRGFLRQNLPALIDQYKNGFPATLPKNLGSFSIVRRFRPASQPDSPTKLKKDHPLRYQEYRAAYKIAERDSLLADTLLTWEIGMKAYLYSLQKRLDDIAVEGFAYSHPLRESVRQLQKGLEANAFIEEMLPVLIHPLTQQNQQSGYGLPDIAHAFTKGLRVGLVQRGLFQSINGQGEISTCPFKYMAGHLAHMNLQESDQCLQEDNPAPGSLFIFIYNQLKNAKPRTGEPKTAP